MGVSLAPEAAAALIALLDRIALEPQNLTAVEGLEDGIDRHLLDSLAGLALPEVRGANACVDIGSGAGFPGLTLAMARPDLAVTLVESERRKADWLRRAAVDCPNVRVVADRSEHLAATEREGYPLATLRAVGAPAICLELAAPLVAVGGAIVLWRGSDADPAIDEQSARAAAALGLEPGVTHATAPFTGSRRSLQVFAKTGPTPSRYPRRAGRAAARPLGSVR